MSKRLLFIFLLLLTSAAYSQELAKKRNRLTDSVKEEYQVLKDNKNMRQGLYQAIFRGKTPVATGMYQHNERIGTWRFFNQKGQLIETYDYTKKQLVFEAPEDTTSSLRYFVDRDLKPTDKATKPIKIGGRYYGYIPYLQLFTLPNDYVGGRDALDAVVELLVSPGGRLADYKVHLSFRGQIVKVINMNVHLPDPADMVFTPATLNGEPIACRIMIKAYVTDDNHLDFE